MDTVELRRKRIINFTYFALIIGFTFIFFKFCFWPLFPFVFAMFIATLVQKPTNAVVNKIKIKKSFVATFFVLLFYLAIGGVLFLIGIKLIDSVKDLIASISAKISNFPALMRDIEGWVIGALSILPDKFEASAIESISGWFDSVANKSASEVASSIMDSTSGGEGISFEAIVTPLSGILDTVMSIPTFVVSIVVAVLSSCFIAADYDWLSNFLKKQLPAQHKPKLSIAKRVIFTSLGKLVRSYTLIICITGTEVFIGLNILSLLGIYTGGNILTIAVVIAVFDILPVLGTGTFMIPWSVYSLITGKLSLAIGLFIIYVIIYIVRQIIEPKIVGGTVGLPAFLTLMGMFLGSKLFGFIGIFLLPILMIIVKLLNDEGVIHLWKPADKSPDGEPKKPFSFLRKKKSV